ncbi:MAG: VWA domain-containing protein [Acidobacteriaceae bacterium]|nr:VWA domain-containing protein [Acidobacteriaceae bacterium]MBV8570700.1 VWA domain-containing protein [Acidobacteriaceae bacterium]
MRAKCKLPNSIILHTSALLMLAGLVPAQTLPPGQLPPGPPPQPGQLGPAPTTLPRNVPDQTKSTEPAANTVPDEPNDKTIRVSVQNVLVPTTVLDPDGHGYVNGLLTKDFELLDNGAPQKINADFTQQPLSVVLAVQANADIEPLLPEIRNTGVLLQGLVSGTYGDVAILAFDHRMQHLQDFTDDANKLSDAMQKIRAGSSSAALIDAVVEADHMLKRHDPQNVRRRVIILMSRNSDKGSEAHLDETIRAMQFDNVIVYCVDISRAYTALMKKTPYPGPQNGRIPPEALPNLRGSGVGYSETNVVQQEDGNWLNGVPPVYRSIKDIFKKTPSEAFTYFTGGRSYTFASERSLEDAITDIGKDLNSQYLLSYSPSHTTQQESGFHTIKVIVDRPGLKIRTRPGYWWGGGAQQ